MNKLLDRRDRLILKPLLTGARLLTEEGAIIMQHYVDRGYVRLSAALCGPLAVPTGEKMASLTEAGRIALNPCTICGDPGCRPADGTCEVAGSLCECEEILTARKDLALS